MIQLNKWKRCLEMENEKTEFKTQFKTQSPNDATVW